MDKEYTVRCRDCGQPLNIQPGQTEVYDPACGEYTFIRWEQGQPWVIVFEDERQN